MYLKQLDISGFKSFADRTRLTFEPGMVAIVGPNGCGKSNVSDAIRWVLGEQRPTALRCSKLVDVVFNGTDSRKPLGLAEVSITFADCEALLGTEYNEVTVTRRVYRSGEGEYFINKTACRLKDVQRLFMGTGIGTTSYSVMAQGQIDAILSSKPEDRRAVFEEAAGITKFKADRKDALRKIEQTEQNLQRESDILREMKRQIGSLQRQAGKAQRYTELRDELRGVDVYVSKKRIRSYDESLARNAELQREAEGEIAAKTEQVAQAERDAQAHNADIVESGERMASLQAEAASADGAYARAREVIMVNAQRIAEYRSFSERDGREIEETRRVLGEVEMQGESLRQKSELLENGVETARLARDEAERAFEEATAATDALRVELQQIRADGVACDRKSADARDALAQLDEAAREALFRRDRLTAEKTRLEEETARAAEALAEVEARLARATEEETAAQGKMDAAEAAQRALAAKLDDLRANFGSMRAEAAAKEAQLDLLNDAQEAEEAFSAGARAILNGSLALPEGCALGPLADRFSAPAEFAVVLEAALRSWLDAVVVRDGAAAREAVAALEGKRLGSARFVALAGGAKPPRVEWDALPRLLDFARADDAFAAAAEILLGNVFVAERGADAPAEIPAGATVVAKDGAVFRADGTAEAWIPNAAAASPLSRRLLVQETTAALAALRERIEEGRATLETGAAKSRELAEAVRAANAALSDARRVAAGAQGERALVARDGAAIRGRLEATVAELRGVLAAGAEDDARRETLKRELGEAIARRDELMRRAAAAQDELQAREDELSESSRALTEKRIVAARLETELSLVAQQREDAKRRRDELLRSVEGRANGIRGYEESIRRLTDESAELQDTLGDLQERAAKIRARAEAERARRVELQNAYAAAEAAVGAARAALDAVRDGKSRLEVAAAEAAMRRQNVYEHVSQEYGLDATQIMREDDPAWPDGVPPPDDELFARVNRLNADIAALGPVNMVAIEEFRELEERYTREKAQEADLLEAKERLGALIAELNAKSGDLFRSTFEQANANFQKMFTKLFNGGEARLVLLENAEDPLEGGIDIIARPPGKRPQSVTLLSGGERTMTAVALLFAIFRIKPAPFTMLDELDAALDDANIGRFVDTLKDFLDRSQFLIITHNQHTIAGSDLVYGVSQREKGVSKILSMKLADVGVKAK